MGDKKVKRNWIPNNHLNNAMSVMVHLKDLEPSLSFLCAISL